MAWAAVGLPPPFLNGNWAGQNPYRLEKDWAAIRLDQSVNQGLNPEVLPLLTQGPGGNQILNDPDYFAGFPVYDDDLLCPYNYTAEPLLTIYDNEIGQDVYFVDDGVTASYGAGYVRWHTTYARGMSGGPHMWCDGGDCDDAKITGVQAGFMPSNNPACNPPGYCNAVGPDAIDFSQGLLTWMNNNPPSPPAIDCPPTTESDFDENPPTQASGLVARLSPAPFSESCQTPTTGDPPSVGMGLGTSICADTLIYRPDEDNTTGGCTGRENLIVYLPGTQAAPEENQFVLDMAWYAGYRTIGLSYSNAEHTTDWCVAREQNASFPGEEPRECQASYADECAYYTRKERIEGDVAETEWVAGDPVQSPPTFPVDYHYYAPFPFEDSIVFRLAAAIAFADQSDAEDESYACAWGDFLDSDVVHVTVNPQSGTVTNIDFDPLFPVMAGINWERVIIGGWSQGSGHATIIALENEVAGFFMLDGNSDFCLVDPTDDETRVPSSYITDLTAGQEPSGGAPRFGVWHERSGKLDQNNQPIFTQPEEDFRPVLWDDDFPSHTGTLGGLRMAKSEDQKWDPTTEVAEDDIGEGVPPLRILDVPTSVLQGIEGYRTMTIQTDQEWPLTDSCSPHDSVAVSNGAGDRNCMPMDAAGGVPAESAGSANLFEAYVQAFCAMDVP
jgi:hypothetical protein